MHSHEPHDRWTSGGAYEGYMARWSRLVAREFLAWLAIQPGATWLDVGCGTGALSQAILDLAAPTAVLGIDLSQSYLDFARTHIRDNRATFCRGEAQALPAAATSRDVVVTGLALNFMPDPLLALSEMVRVARPGGTIAAYVWDYAGQMGLLRSFWDAAIALYPAAAPLEEGHRFAICHPEPLRQIFQSARLGQVDVRAIDIEMRFADFADYWVPFLAGQGPAAAYLTSLSPTQQEELRAHLASTLPSTETGVIMLTARAWAVRGITGN